MKRRVGIFGGTFNPPHIGHVEAAKAFLESAQLDSLIIMPAFIPPHKEYDSVVSCEQRLQMCKLAFADIPRAYVSDLEISRQGKSYTYLTLQELSAEDTELYFLCGTDMILTMGNWKNPDIIFSLAKICYIRREQDNEITHLLKEKCLEYSDKFNATVIPIDAEVIEISSSEIRNDLASNSEFLSKQTLDYIHDMGLYK